MNKGKIFTIILWAVLGANYILSLYVWLNYFALVLLSVHAIECVIFYKRIKNAEKNIIYGLVQTMIFGVLYIGDLKK
jgi:uncharacterized protein YhhL (DUF1145 family)|tara:strand:+ start:2209 stop:2439 length:231 start_codon:yes stop_codon:yes gene_type:complete